MQLQTTPKDALRVTSIIEPAKSIDLDLGYRAPTNSIFSRISARPAIHSQTSAVNIGDVTNHDESQIKSLLC